MPDTIPGLVTRPLLRADRSPFLIRADEAGGDEGTFDGYACVWDVRDAYGTTFRRGCFTDGGLDTDAYALLWMHNPDAVLGVFYAAEDDHGLHITGRWDDTPAGQDARARAKSGSAPGLSVGFVPVMVDPDDESTFTQCRLVETSQITARMAAVPGAALVGVRSEPVTVEPGEREHPPVEDDRDTEDGKRGAAAIALAVLALTGARVKR